MDRKIYEVSKEDFNIRTHFAFEFYIQKLERKGIIQIYNDGPYSVWISTKDPDYIKQLDELCEQGKAKKIGFS